MTEQEELQMLRRLAELEAKASAPAAAPGTAYKPDGRPLEQAQQDPTFGMSKPALFAAGAGRGAMQTARGVRQIGASIADAGQTGLRTGQPVGPRTAAINAEVADAAQRDKPLLSTGAGQAGNIAGMAASYAPLALVPGANTVAGATVIGAAGGYLGTPGGPSERAEAGKMGAAGGAAGILAGRALGAGGRALLNRSQAAGTQAASNNAVRDATLQQGLAEGYSVSPTMTNPTAWNRLLEGIAGKLTTAQGASMRNQGVTNTLARRALGIGGEGGISPADFDAAKAPAFAIYNEVAGVSQDASQALAAWRQANYNATRYDRFYGRTFDPSAQDAADAARLEAEQWHQVIEQEAVRAGRPDLAQSLTQARRELGRIGSVERATSEATGDVSARDLAREFRNGRPLTGELRTIGQFASAFPKQTATVDSAMPGISPLDVSAGVVGAAAAGHAAPLAMIGVRPAVRGMILSRPYQQAFAAPQYGPNALQRGVVNLVEDRRTQNALSRVGAADAQQE